jgi:hypothetical protein
MSHEEVVAAFLRRHALPTQVFQNASSKNVNLIDPHGFSRGFAWVNGQDQCACGGSEPPRTDCKDESHELRYLNDEEAKCLKQNNYGMYSGRLVCFEDLPVFLNFQNWLSSLTAAVAFMSSGTAPLTPLSPTPNATAFLKTVTTPPPKSSSGYFSQLYHSYAQGSKCTHSPEKLKELGDEVAATSAGVSSALNEILEDLRKHRGTVNAVSRLSLAHEKLSSQTAALWREWSKFSRDTCRLTLSERRSQEVISKFQHAIESILGFESKFVDENLKLARGLLDEASRGAQQDRAAVMKLKAAYDELEARAGALSDAPELGAVPNDVDARRNELRKVASKIKRLEAKLAATRDSRTLSGIVAELTKLQEEQAEKRERWTTEKLGVAFDKIQSLEKELLLLNEKLRADEEKLKNTKKNSEFAKISSDLMASQQAKKERETSLAEALRTIQSFEKYQYGFYIALASFLGTVGYLLKHTHRDSDKTLLKSIDHYAAVLSEPTTATRTPADGASEETKSLSPRSSMISSSSRSSPFVPVLAESTAATKAPANAASEKTMSISPRSSLTSLSPRSSVSVPESTTKEADSPASLKGKGKGGPPLMASRPSPESSVLGEKLSHTMTLTPSTGKGKGKGPGKGPPPPPTMSSGPVATTTRVQNPWEQVSTRLLKNAKGRKDTAAIETLTTRIKDLLWGVFRPYVTLLYVRNCHPRSKSPSELHAEYTDEKERVKHFWHDETKQRLSPEWLKTISPSSVVQASLKRLETSYLQTGIVVGMKRIEDDFKARHPDIPLHGAVFKIDLMNALDYVWKKYRERYGKAEPWSFDYLTVKVAGGGKDCVTDDFLNPRPEHVPQRFRQLQLASLTDENPTGKGFWQSLVAEFLAAVTPSVTPSITMTAPATVQTTKKAWLHAIEEFVGQELSKRDLQQLLISLSSLKLTPFDVIFCLAASVHRCTEKVKWRGEELKNIRHVSDVVDEVCASLRKFQTYEPPSNLTHHVVDSAISFYEDFPLFLGENKEKKENKKKEFKELPRVDFKEAFLNENAGAVKRIVQNGVQGAAQLNELFTAALQKKRDLPAFVPPSLESFADFESCMRLLNYLIDLLQDSTGCRKTQEKLDEPVAKWPSCALASRQSQR